MSKKKTGKNRKNSDIVKSLTMMLELPKEITLNLPLLTFLGNEELSIENYKGIIEYTNERIRINTSCGVIKLDGKNMSLKHITSESIAITGKILNIAYLV